MTSRFFEIFIGARRRIRHSSTRLLLFVNDITGADSLRPLLQLLIFEHLMQFLAIFTFAGSSVFIKSGAGLFSKIDVAFAFGTSVVVDFDAIKKNALLDPSRAIAFSRSTQRLIL